MDITDENNMSTILSEDNESNDIEEIENLWNLNPAMENRVAENEFPQVPHDDYIDVFLHSVISPTFFTNFHTDRVGVVFDSRFDLKNYFEWNLNPAMENRVAENEFPQVPHDDYIDVFLHSVISPTFFTNFHTDRVGVVFDSRFDLKNYFEVKIERPRADGYIVGSVTVKVPVACRLCYNYVVLHDDSTCTFEHFVSSGEWVEKGSLRRLPDHQTVSSKDICHYYDGIVRGKEELIGKYKNWWNNVKKMFGAEDEYKKFLKEDIELSVSAFLPKQLLDYFSDRDSDFEEAVLVLNQVNGSLKQLYHEICKFIGTSFDTLFANVLSLHVKKMINHLDRVNKERLYIAVYENNHQLHLAKAAIAVHFVVLFDLKIDIPEKDMLCEALLPSPDYVTRTCPDVDQMKKVMPFILKEVTLSILTFARRIAGKSDNPGWLLCVPLIHFMFKHSKPFEDVPHDVNHNDEEQKHKWWGTVYIREATRKFKNCLEWNRPSSEIVKMLTPYFEVDYLLPRTLLASLHLKMFQEVSMTNMIPADILLAASYYHCCNLRDSQELDLLKNVLEHVASQIIGSDKDISLPCFNSAFRTNKIATDLLNNVIKFKEEKILFLASEIYLTSLHTFLEMPGQPEQQENHDYTKDDQWKEYKIYRERIVHWLENDLFDNKEFKLWNAAFQLNLPDGRIKSSFTEFLKFRFRQTVHEKISPEKLVEIYCSHADTFEETVQEILSKAVLEAVESCSTFDWRKNKDGKSNLRLSELLSKVFEKEWDSKKLDNPIQDLEHALMWEPFHTYMELFCENPEAVNLNCQRIMAKLNDITKDLIEDLLQGRICVGSLRMLMSRKKQFRKIVPAMKISKQDIILKILDGRQLELRAFEKSYETVQEFTHLCTKCKADTEPLKDQLKTVITDDINAVSLDTLVDTSILSQQRDLESYQPIIIAFKLLSPQNMQRVPDIVNCCQGSLFMKIWKKKGKEVNKNLSRMLTINEVFNCVWHQALRDWQILCKKFVSGDLTFTEFNKWFKTRDPDELRKELMFLDNHKNTQWIDERLFQVKNFDMLENCIYGAKVIIEVVKEFDLKEENFIQIFDISRVKNVEDTPMKRLDKGLLNTCSILREITKERADCLEELIRCKTLVQWLQKTMKGGLKELQVFVDLASISAGEGDMEIAKVNCLHSATTGYAPLIFNLRKECDAKEFLKKCQDVWNDLDSNPQLPQKLRDTSNQIKWLKSVEEFHGAAEVTTLAQAEAINKRGVYQIGNLTRTPFVDNPELSDVLDLQVHHKEGRTSKKDKYYRYEQLHDLQSRLMLVAGKAEQGKDDVERFMLILDSVVRLGSIYVKLISDGCVLFSHWRIRIICNTDSTVCAFILFGSDQESQAIKTRIDEKNKDVSLVIQQLARFLEQCHNKWLNYIDQTRDEYFCLTHFTVDQMVILQKELVKVGSEAVPSPLVYSLLSAVKRGCTKDDLTKAVSSAKTNAIKTVTKGKKLKHHKTDSVKLRPKLNVGTDEKKCEETINSFLQKINESGFSIELGKMALKNVDPIDIQGGIAWCMDNEDNFREPTHKKITPKKTDDTLVSITESIFRRLDIKSREAKVTKVVNILEQVWETFLTTFSFGLSDYLSIEHLGIILNKLAEQESINIHRDFSNCFSSGEPNLLICPQSEIYKTVISVYSNDEHSPLPQADEVLICTSNTTLDMVQIFWKRVFHSAEGKIFCLVNADLLDYDVSDKAENSLEKHMTVADCKDIKYRLVVICSSENEYKSRIVAALDKYHRPALYTDVCFIRTYLFTKFQVESESKRTPACAVDFDRCSVRVVKSWRAGIGKTLFKNRMIEGLSQMIGGKVTSTSIPVHHKKLNSDEIMEVFKKEIISEKKQSQRIFHIDISHEVQEGVDTFLFQLLILGCHRHSSGYLWRRSDMDYYIIESMPLLDMDNSGQRKGGPLKYIHSCLDILPSVTCRSPRECLNIILNPQNKADDFTEHDILFDSQIFNSETIQRPYRYLRKLMTSSKKVHKTSSPHLSSNYQRRLKTKTEHSTLSNADENTHCLDTYKSELGVKRSSFERQMRLQIDIKTKDSNLFGFRSPRKTKGVEILDANRTPNMPNAPKRSLETYSHRVEEDDSPVFGYGKMTYRRKFEENKKPEIPTFSNANYKTKLETGIKTEDLNSFGFRYPWKTDCLETLDTNQTPNMSNAPTRNLVNYSQRVDEDDPPVFEHGKFRGKFEANKKPEIPTLSNANYKTRLETGIKTGDLNPFGFRPLRRTNCLETLDTNQTPNMSISPTRNLVKYSQRVEEDDPPVFGHDKFRGKFDANIKPETPTINNADDNTNCLETLLSHCGINDPSWSELYHFVSFLNRQLEDFEASAFCSIAAQQDLPGFADFVLTCLLQMSRDFATRSLVVSEETPIQMMQRHEKYDNVDIIQQYQMRRTWETSPHPYLFFNPDHHSMTFLGFNIERRSGNLIDHQTRKVLEQQIMTPDLFDALEKNDVNLAENFDILQRPQKIAKLCQVMGLETVYDPDGTYELTTDNVKKILAIYMRFRCGIPVIIMGETGCGKTRLVKFMCSLQQPPGVDVENMILVKVHGGTKSSDIIRKVRDAEDIASRNTDTYPKMFTVLFFDEANTTEAIGVIKEMMCDKSLNGKPMKLHQSLKIVAACNPYRKHSDELIQRLEQAGLGYHVASDKTTDTIGHVPMRRLVYRVQPLPQSMLPLVWDFGQLTADVEKMYIRQMVLRCIKNRELPSLQNLDEVLSDILTASQDFMRNQKDECSFVSLRDVERTLQLMSWFKKQSQKQNLLFRKMTQKRRNVDPESDSDDEIPEIKQQQEVDDVTRSLILAIGVSYHACLKNRTGYRNTVAKYFKSPLRLKRGADEIEKEISKCQSVFLDSVKLAPNIARNQALKENVFMMIVCIEMRIPMFLVGKPGSSKSLAKTIVSDSMQGNAAQDEIFKNYKQVQVVSYQCSPLSVPGGIIGAFRQCAAYQKDKDLGRYVSVVVLDEVGLAEDSPRMPLKTLHPLLEDGCIDDEIQEKYKKVAFIGISNWSLDPAKMNRGILVQREVPDITELIESAEGICSTNRNVLKCIKPLIQPLAESYLDLFQQASAEMREFFGLRDFYSLIKMLYAFASKSEQKPTWLQLQHCILRNFGGLDTIKPVDIFCRKVIVERYEQPKDDDPDNSPPGLIQACLVGDKISNNETRYLLLLIENYGALAILQQKIFAMENVVVIFGSSFPSDQEYTQICRNINSIKVCMETGSTVVLLNLENLYESLYDALNQYYVEFGGERYVDLGLGTHRVKCRVHKKFRLIVVAEKHIVYDKFPIPLINRLEKHFLSLKTMLTAAQQQLAIKLQEWAHTFCEVKVPLHLRHLRPRQDAKRINEAFVGFHADACAAIILHACQEKNCTDENIVELEEEVLDFSKEILLWCASPSAVLLREDKIIFAKYFLDQHHENIIDYLHFKLNDLKEPNLTVQITTFSKLLSNADIEMLCKSLASLRRDNVLLVTLQSFDTEQQFRRQIRSFFQHTNTSDLLLIVQCDSGDDNEKLIACARYAIKGELQQVAEKTSNIHVVLLIQVPGIACGRFTGFQCGAWHSVHIDDVHPEDDDIPTVAEMYVQSVGDLLYPVIIESQDTSDTTEDVEVPDGEELSSDYLKDEEEHFTIEEQEIDHVTRTRNSNALDLEGLNDFIADQDRQREAEPNAELRGSLKGVLWCCSRSGKQNRVQQRNFVDLSYHRYDTYDDYEIVRKDSAVMSVDYRRDTTDILLHEEHDHTVETTLNDRPTQNIEDPIPPKQKDINLVQIEIARDKIQNLKKHFKLDNLIKSCIQPALRFVKDSKSNSSKVLSRLKILMNCLQNKGDDFTLLSGINKHLSILLKQREQVTGTLSTNWLAQEAIKPQNVNRPGTFRKFAVRCLEAKIVPVLAGIIAFMDTNNNLDLLSHDKNWKTDIWLKIMNNPFFTQLKYSAIPSSSSKQEMDEVPVKSTAMDGKMFSACMPFSWLIFRQVDDILRKTVHRSQAEDNDFDIVMKSSEIFQSLPLGELLTTYSEQYRQEVLQAFIKDLVYMVHPVTSDTECELICEEVMNGCRNLIQSEFRRLIPSMFGCHVTFIRHAVRFKHFSHIIRIRQERGQEIMNMQQNYSSSHLITDEEITLDIFALHMVVGQLDPGKSTFDDKDNRKIWMRDVSEYRPVVERVFGHFHQDCKRIEKNYGSRSQEGIEEIRYKWNRAFIVKMFLDHVCTNSNVQTNVMLLWTALSDGAKMTEVKSLEKIEKYLKDCNQNIIAQCSGKDNEEAKDFRRRCNSFFMEVVSLLCFGTGTPPSVEVIDKLLTYITGQSQSESAKKVGSKQLTIFDSSMDQAPVIRSFLLQQIIATCSDQDVQNHLSAYFTHAKDLLNTAKQPDQYIELCILVLQCFEDSLHQRHTGNDKIDIATQILTAALPKISMDINILEKIKYIANVKFALVLVAKLIHEMNSTTLNFKTLDEEKRRLLEAASCICEESNSQWPRKFLVKQLCRCHGIDIYHAIVNSDETSFQWICLPELREDYHQIKECNDRYIVFGKDYKELRDTVVETVLTENSDKLGQILQKGNFGWKKRVQLLLALHREICLKNIKSEQVFSEKGTSFLRGYLKNHAMIKKKSFIDKLFCNSIWILRGNITEGMTLAEQNILCLLTHYLVLMLEIPGKTSLFTPLHKIAIDPGSMLESFFPTMPQDDLHDVKVMVIKALQFGRTAENPVFYRCPNGHPYVIGDCGRAYTQGECRECGAEIGGQRHQLNADNINDTGEDGTQKGHVLGSATYLKPIDGLYRKLSKASVAILRLLTHMSMYIGTNTNIQAICQTIKPAIDPGEVCKYLLLHLNLDLTSVQTILGINRDDAVLFLHFLLVKIMDTLKDETLSRDMSGLLSKESRAKWEEQFAKKYIEPFLQDVKTKLSTCNQMLLDDQRLGTDILMQILYETDKYPHRKDIQNLQEIPAMWRYRELITIKHLMQNLEGTERTMPVPVLRLFLQEDYHLRAIRFIPSIIRLQRMLIQKYNRKLDRTEIAALTIRDVKREMKEDGRNEDFEQLLNDFKMAWTCVKDLLKNWVCPVDGKLVVVDEIYLRSEIANNANTVSCLIPSYRNAGLCSYILLCYLIKHQNLFLQNICSKTNVRIDSLPIVHVKDISSAHLISYHPDKDLLPMVFANCNYSFEVGQGTRIEYNFTNLERQLMDRFLFSKSIVTGLEEIETITYRSESTNAVVFLELCEKVKQERLNPAVRSQICGELHMRNLPELCDSLDNLDVTISFLKSVGSNPSMSLNDFMENTLKIDKPFISTKAKTASKCKHAMSLWISFALERAKQLAKYDRKAFEGVPDSFKTDLTMEQEHEIEEMLARSPAEQINTLLELIFECIVFKIDVPQNINDEDYIDISQISFRDQLIGYIDTSPFEEDLQIDDSLMVVIGQMPSDMDDQLRILTAQSVDFWQVVNRCRQRKMR